MAIGSVLARELHISIRLLALSPGAWIQRCNTLVKLRSLSFGIWMGKSRLNTGAQS